MRRLSDLLPEVALQLGLDEELQLSRAMASWERLVGELVPAAAGATAVLEIRPPDAGRQRRRSDRRAGAAAARRRPAGGLRDRARRPPAAGAEAGDHAPGGRTGGRGTGRGGEPRNG